MWSRVELGVGSFMMAASENSEVVDILLVISMCVAEEERKGGRGSLIVLNTSR